MSSRVTGRRSRPASTSQIRSGTWPRDRWPFNQRATAVCSYLRDRPRARPAWLYVCGQARVRDTGLVQDRVEQSVGLHEAPRGIGADRVVAGRSHGV
ncbi:hypothetical protein SHIRM173S_08731 [Streptomyces hirsutus]